MSPGKILIADNDLELAMSVEAQIRVLGLETLRTASGYEVARSFIQHRPEALILRDTLPGIDGWEVARLIRAISDAPIILISNNPDRLARQRALQVSDDYVTPPWQWERLPARLNALLRRSSQDTAYLPDPYDDGYLRVDISGRSVCRDQNPVALSETEFKLLSYFVRHPNCTLSFAQILQSVWCHHYLKAKAEVTHYVRYLRQKIEPDPAHPAYFQTIRGVGYLFSSRL